MYKPERSPEELTEFTAMLNGQKREEWNPPEPFEKETPLPEFPVDQLPEPVAQFVEAVAANTQTDPAMGGLWALGILSTCFQRKLRVRVDTNWAEPLGLYTFVVARPSELKSPVLSALTRPLYQYQSTRRQAEQAELAVGNEKKNLLERKLEAARKEAANGKLTTKQRQAAEDEALALAAELAEFKVQYPVQLVVNDVTPERIVTLLEEQDGAITLASGEAGIFDTIRHGRYSNGGGLDYYLSGFSGEPFTVDRQTRKGSFVERPAMTMMLAGQAFILRGILKDATTMESGLVARFLYALPQSNVGHRRGRGEPIPDEVANTYTSFVTDALDMVTELDVINMSEPAKVVLLDEWKEKVIEPRLIGAWDEGGLHEWGGKIVGTTARIAALLHCGYCAGVGIDPSSIGITAETARAAISIAEVLGAHAERAFSAMDTDTETGSAKYLWSRLRSAGKAELSKSKAKQMCQRFHTVEEMTPALELLENMGYIRIVEQKTGTRGRPSQTIQINPLALK